MEDAAIKGAISKDHWSRDHNEGMRARPLHFGEPIAARLGVDYPFPPHLEYAYPPPDGNILTNIVNALIAVPRFYTQVLHLMNKMNIPAPFRLPLPTPPLPPSTPAPPSPSLTLPPLPPPATSRSQVTNMPSDESEMESSEEDVEGKYNSSGVSKTAKSGYKRPRCETIVGPGIDKDVAHEAVGVKPSTLVPKEIPMIKKKNPVIQIRIAPKVIHDGKVDKTNNDGEEAEKEADDLKPYATLEDLERGKLPPEEILSLPMFKNYTAGSPTSVLYIKNLAKDVLNDDLYYIFGSLFEGIDEAKSALTVKLMQEGRMRGQAFVTFPSIELAQLALNLVNGYVFKGKPMIIQFGRNPGAVKGS
ncbi:U11/U12 small nuclear ribonucleoprotein 65 kDa protein isoform X2 [Cucumis melo]|uniref:U11/U12 small nuclear ribonucleoprotein 65 kDa protein isoform X2 n=1 Tax=Cucumis melo TaxID=3656 RepID=A0A1S3BJY8_CUCME|nr:U11/U12 small nuclear ribonucleoprotein 65 kDa protein isoform X2 [Cucumis melo]XP_050935025.1 U11/U12 small nuclear ribonucleoprotein 65 kDa protein isoform X2 [Cucumis melo]XP_050935026.1 U11/U12 small nuclear ribonucleoprotein 65 kDa protein isoform X2 [Cucumis melo]XP_050935027.1 U11/U12 small nuclear ribonucleoprotein 65 kDa protein isoform X2 [Cucumis melo]